MFHSAGMHHGQNSFKYLRNISPIIPWLSLVISIILEGHFVFWVIPDSLVVAVINLCWWAQVWILIVYFFPSKSLCNIPLEAIGKLCSIYLYMWCNQVRASSCTLSWSRQVGPQIYFWVLNLFTILRIYSEFAGHWYSNIARAWNGVHHC